MISNKSFFIVSLDFELYWGVRNKRTIQDYEENLNGAGKAVKEILEAFQEYDIHATWAAVGFLFFKDTESLKKNFPDELPRYVNQALCPYRYINAAEVLEARYHLAPELVDLIRKHGNQEIATHTFSHYYCLEKIHNPDAFKADLSSAINAAEDFGLQIKSIVFPKNQLNRDILPILTELGITSYRGNESSWAYNAVANKKNNAIFRRAFRLLDAYFNLSGYNTYQIDELARENPYNIPSSRFLRPCPERYRILDNLRLFRIKKAMSYAAKNQTVFHMWWHPHNFGKNILENIIFLKKILKHYEILKKKYGMISFNMGELAEFIDST